MLRIIAIVVTLLALVLCARFVYLSMTTRAPDTLAESTGRLAPCPKTPNCVSSLATSERHRVEALVVAGDAAAAFERAAEIVATMPGARVVTVDQGYIRAEFSSRIFRFVDDLELVYDHSVPGFQVRSASRVGRSDLGANRKRVEALRALLG